MEVGKYICQLLFEYDCVIIPDFGGFITNYKPAEINYSRNFFTPPSKDIVFNKTIIHNDGLLINYISHIENIDYNKVKEKLERYVEALYKKLHDKETIYFEELGSFYFDKYNKLQFKPEYLTNYLIDSYGLASFHFPSLENYTSEIRIDNKFKDMPPMKNFIRKKTTKRILISIPIIIALAVIPLKTDLFKNNNIDFSSLNPIKSPDTQKVVAITDTDTSVNIDNAIDKLTEKQNALLYKEKETEPEPEKPILIRYKYYLITGSFRNYEYAQNLHNKLTDDGYQSEVLEKENELYRVSISSFTNKNLALKELYKIRSEKEKDSVWLLKKELL
ncbi:MAG: SPOR domain-containing protein [Bacteroidales bacterium]|nr:SPOR domain-containing protein [Bacteroidales bacterium]